MLLRPLPDYAVNTSVYKTFFVLVVQIIADYRYVIFKSVTYKVIGCETNFRMRNENALYVIVFNKEFVEGTEIVFSGKVYKMNETLVEIDPVFP